MWHVLASHTWPPCSAPARRGGPARCIGLRADGCHALCPSPPPQASHAKDTADALSGKVLAQDPKLIDAQRKLQQLQDNYTIATK